MLFSYLLLYFLSNQKKVFFFPPFDSSNKFWIWFENFLRMFFHAAQSQLLHKGLHNIGFQDYILQIQEAIEASEQRFSQWCRKIGLQQWKMTLRWKFHMFWLLLALIQELGLEYKLILRLVQHVEFTVPQWLLLLQHKILLGFRLCIDIIPQG